MTDYPKLVRQLDQSAAGPGLARGVPPPEADEDDAPPAAGRPRARTLRELLANPGLLEPPRVVVRHLAWAGRATLLASREGVGKSTLTAAASAAVSSGGTFLGEPCPAGDVLWAAYEEHLSDVALRAQRFRTDADRLHLLLRTPDPVADLVAEARRLRPTLWVVDSLHALASATGDLTDAGDAAQWQPLLAALVLAARDTDAALVLLHHAKKSDNTYRDSSAIGAAPDVVLELRRPPDGSPRRELAVAKARWPLSDVTLELCDDGYRLVTGGTLTLDAKLLAFVTQHPRTSQVAIRAAMGVRHDETDAALARLIASGAARDDRRAENRPHAYVAVGAAESTPSEDADVPF